MNTVVSSSAVANTRILIFHATHLLDCIKYFPKFALFYQAGIMEEVYKGHGDYTALCQTSGLNVSSCHVPFFIWSEKLKLRTSVLAVFKLLLALYILLS
jgi:hypothetical protein